MIRLLNSFFIEYRENISCQIQENSQMKNVKNIGAYQGKGGRVPGKTKIVDGTRASLYESGAYLAGPIGKPGNFHPQYFGSHQYQSQSKFFRFHKSLPGWEGERRFVGQQQGPSHAFRNRFGSRFQFQVRFQRHFQTLHRANPLGIPEQHKAEGKVRIEPDLFFLTGLTGCTG